MSLSTLIIRGWPIKGRSIGVFTITAASSFLLFAATKTSSYDDVKTGSSSYCKCEAEDHKHSDGKLPLLLNHRAISTSDYSNTRAHNIYKDVTHQDKDMILCSSPILVDPAIKHHRPTSAKPKKWWRLQWRQKASTDKRKNNNKLSWWQRIGQTFFVITRGVEIVVRLSPLIILTPTAIVVSYITPFWKRYIFQQNEDNMQQLLTIDGLQENGNSGGDIYATQFQESNLAHSDHATTILSSSTWASDLAWQYTLHTLQCLGPAFLKLGQWAATRRDVFPIHMCIRLSKLHDDVSITEWKYTEQSLIESFGNDYESQGLVVMKDKILGSGSAAQVYKGKLTSASERTRDVAIKVLHPNIRQLVERDLALMILMAEFIDKCIPLQVVKMLSLPRAVSNFANVIERQVDLRVEGSNLQTFRHNFSITDDDHLNSKHLPIITFPKPEVDWISEKILVEEYAGDNAVPISKYLADDSPEGLKIRKKIAGPLLRGFLKMVFIDNMIHGDLQ